MATSVRIVREFIENVFRESGGGWLGSASCGQQQDGSSRGSIPLPSASVRIRVRHTIRLVQASAEAVEGRRVAYERFNSFPTHAREAHGMQGAERCPRGVSEILPCIC